VNLQQAQQNCAPVVTDVNQWRGTVFLTMFQSETVSSRRCPLRISDRHVPAWLHISCSPQGWGRDCWKAT